MLTHKANLPFGYTVEFTWKDNQMQVEWTPAFPSIQGNRALTKFKEAYFNARAVFFGKVADCIGGGILVVDPTDERGEVIRPSTRH